MSKNFNDPAALSAGQESPVFFEGDAGVGPEPVCLVWRKDVPLAMRGIQPRLLSRPSHNLVTMPTELYRPYN